MSHSLRRLCGLKSILRLLCFLPCRSQPAKAVWIEMMKLLHCCVACWSQPAKAVWIEMSMINRMLFRLISHSLRRLCGLK